MEKERRIKTLSIMALIVAVLGLTVAFAALSQTLTITGTASIPNGTSTWNVHFDTTYGVNGVDVSQTSSNGTSYGQHGDITVSGTSISGINAILTKPGESVTYGFQVKNEGNADGYVNEIVDYIPEGFTFDSSKNSGWTKKGTNMVIYNGISGIVIKTGESKKIILYLYVYFY